MPRPAAAPDVMNALRGKMFAPPAHALLEQVRNGTGYRRRRYADAIAVSLYPSRGIWIAGIEVKVNRGDWLGELHNPEKAEEIGRFCHYWWIAAPPDVVQIHELPETWGLVVATGTKTKIAKVAPRREPEALSLPFVASILRNASSALDDARSAGHAAGFASAEERYGIEAQEALRLEVSNNKRARDMAERDRDQALGAMRMLKGELQQLEREIGLPAGSLSNSYGNKRHLAREMKIAQAVGQLHSATFREIADQLAALEADVAKE